MRSRIWFRTNLKVSDRDWVEVRDRLRLRGGDGRRVRLQVGLGFKFGVVSAWAQQ